MPDYDSALGDLTLDIVRAANLMERLGDSYAQEANLGSVQQYMILSMLSMNDGLSMGELRQNTLVTKQAVTGLVHRMKKDGLIDTHQDTEDRRITRVRLTAKGETALEATVPKRMDGNRKAFSVLSEEEISQLSTILSKLIAHLDT